VDVSALAARAHARATMMDVVDGEEAIIVIRRRAAAMKAALLLRGGGGGGTDDAATGQTDGRTDRQPRLAGHSSPSRRHAPAPPRGNNGPLPHGCSPKKEVGDA